MKTQTKFFTAAAATAIAGLVSAAPAQAITFKTDGLIQGDGSTVKFDFLGSYGGFQSGFGIYDATNDAYHWLFQETQGTIASGANAWVGDLVLDNKGDDSIINVLEDTFTFVEGNEYSFFQGSSGGENNATVFSTNDLNTSQSWVTYTNQAKFFEDLSILDDDSYQYYKNHVTGDLISTNSDLAQADGSLATLGLGNTGLIAFEDNGIKPSTGEYYHGDWNDFLVSATVVEQPGASVPEPATLAGLAMVAGAMTVTRRRKNGGAS